MLIQGKNIVETNQQVEFTYDVSVLMEKCKIAITDSVNAKQYALKKLMQIKENHSKMEKITYKSFKIQPYLISKIFPEEARVLFKFRTHMAQVKSLIDLEHYQM